MNKSHHKDLMKLTIKRTNNRLIDRFDEISDSEYVLGYRFYINYNLKTFVKMYFIGTTKNWKKVKINETTRAEIEI